MREGKDVKGGHLMRKERAERVAYLVWSPLHSPPWPSWPPPIRPAWPRAPPSERSTPSGCSTGGPAWAWSPRGNGWTPAGAAEEWPQNRICWIVILAWSYPDSKKTNKRPSHLVHEGADKVDETTLQLGQVVRLVPVHHGLGKKEKNDVNDAHFQRTAAQQQPGLTDGSLSNSFGFKGTDTDAIYSPAAASRLWLSSFYSMDADWSGSNSKQLDTLWNWAFQDGSNRRILARNLGGPGG